MSQGPARVSARTPPPGSRRLWIETIQVIRRDRFQNLGAGGGGEPGAASSRSSLDHDGIGRIVPSHETGSMQIGRAAMQINLRNLASESWCPLFLVVLGGGREPRRRATALRDAARHARGPNAARATPRLARATARGHGGAAAPHPPPGSGGTSYLRITSLLVCQARVDARIQTTCRSTAFGPLPFLSGSIS
jgi:hypothetical protein